MVGEQARTAWPVPNHTGAVWQRCCSGFVFVKGSHLAVAVLATLLALRTPLSWKKTHLAEVNAWLGFVVHPNLCQVLMAANKHIPVMEVLQTMVEGHACQGHQKGGDEFNGQLHQDAAAAMLWAWKMATTTVGRPPKVVTSCCVSSSTRLSPSTPLTCQNLLGGL